MAKPQSTLLVTRPRVQAEQFLKACEGRLGTSIQNVISPIIEIKPVGLVPDLTQFETTVVTSSNGVHRLGEALRDQRTAVVGEATAELARSFGAEVVMVAQTAAELLQDTAPLRPPVLVCRGVHARVDLKAEMTAIGIEARSCILYDQASCALSAEAQDLLIGSGPILAPVFSPRSADLLSAEKIVAPTIVLALSQAVAEAWVGSEEIRVAIRPDAKAMIDLVAEAL